MDSFVSIFRKVPVSFRAVIGLLVNTTGMSVNSVKALMLVNYAIKSKVHRNLLDKQYIDRLKSVCTHICDSVLYSDVVKGKVLQYVNKTGSHHTECTGKVVKVNVNKVAPQRGKLFKGKIARQFGNHTDVKTGLYSNTKEFTGQCLPHVNSIKPSAQVSEVPNRGFVHTNRFAILGEHIESHVCNSKVEVTTVSRCQNNAQVNDKNGIKVLDKGKNTVTVDMAHENPVQGGHDSCFSPGSNSFNPVMTQFVEENSNSISGCREKGGVRRDNHVKSCPLKSSTGDYDSNAHCDKYALELNTSLKNIKMQHACNKIPLHSALFLFMG